MAKRRRAAAKTTALPEPAGAVEVDKFSPSILDAHEAAVDAAEGTVERREPVCPTCGSPDPARHPAMQHEGEVQPCGDSWHGSLLTEDQQQHLADVEAAAERQVDEVQPVGDTNEIAEPAALAPVVEQTTQVLEKLHDVEPAAVETGMAAVMERLALNPNVDVDKLERLFELQDRLTVRQQDRDAERQFNVAFAAMQDDIPEVDERGQIYNKAGTEVVATFGKFEDIMRLLRPVLAKHGFSLSFKSEEVEGGRLKTTGFLRHVGGHHTTSEFIGAPDTSGFKNDTQALGSTKAYGRRYVTFDLVNITTRGMDDDGQSSQRPEPPAGYEGWAHDLEANAHEGIATFAQSFNDSKKVYRDYATKYDSDTFKRVKAAALAADKQRKEAS